MRKLIFALSTLVLSSSVFGQNVGIGTNTPDPSAKLDVTSTNSGLLLPRVSLVSNTDAVTIPSPATSLLVYNTNVFITGGDGVGFYYWYAGAWFKLKSNFGGVSITDWTKTGNSFTSPVNNFIGTIDPVDFVTRTSNVERMRVSSAGNVGIGITNPLGRLHLLGTSQNTLIVESPDYPEISYRVSGATKSYIGIVTTAGGYFTGSSVDDWIFRNEGGASIKFGRSATTDMTIASTGNVGIGIIAPTQKLDVQGGNARINNAFIGDVGHGANYGGIAHSSSATTTGYALIQSSTGDYTLINKENTGTGWIGFRVANADVAVITNGGNFGVGTTAPAYKIEANGDIYANGGWMRVSGNQGLYFQSYGGGWHMTDATWIRAYNNKPVYVQNLLRADQGLYATDFVRLRSADANQYGTINAFGLVGITLEQHTSESSGFHSDGDQADIWSPGDSDRLLRVWDEDGMVERWYLNGVGTSFTVSDRTKKTNIVNYTNGLDKILSLQAYSYNYKLNGDEAEKVATGEHIEVKTIGVMAQDVEKVIPEAVNTDENGNKHMSYDMLVPVLIEAIKEQQEQIDELKAKIEVLEAD